ncbi:MAG: ribosome small subunit-dependent GTPase A [Clostridiales bacterium]|nr:ribosome small subunit-dependent GTPase A [Clostridiales bacterium]
MARIETKNTNLPADSAASPPCALNGGVVVKVCGGFYYVLHEGQALPCKQRGKVRQSDGGLYAGDRVLFSFVNPDEGVIDRVLERENQLPRPKVANVGGALLVLSARTPGPDWLLLDKMLVMAGFHGLRAMICLNKTDLADAQELTLLHQEAEVYKKMGCVFLTVSAKNRQGIEEMRAGLGAGLWVLAGASGVGKSSLLNALLPREVLATGQISARLGRGKHTTRHVEILCLTEEVLVADTPGFSLLDLPEDLQEQDLASYYPDFAQAPPCRFDGCRHNKEPQCGVKNAVEQGLVSAGRYERYLKILYQLMEREVKY